MKIIKKEIAELNRKNQQLKAENTKLEADMTYIAMMADIDIPTATEDEKEKIGNVRED